MIVVPLPAPVRFTVTPLSLFDSNDSPAVIVPDIELAGGAAVVA